MIDHYKYMYEIEDIISSHEKNLLSDMRKIIDKKLNTKFENIKNLSQTEKELIHEVKNTYMTKWSYQDLDITYIDEMNKLIFNCLIFYRINIHAQTKQFFKNLGMEKDIKIYEDEEYDDMGNHNSYIEYPLLEDPDFTKFPMIFDFNHGYKYKQGSVNLDSCKFIEEKRLLEIIKEKTINKISNLIESDLKESRDYDYLKEEKDIKKYLKSNMYLNFNIMVVVGLLIKFGLKQPKMTPIEDIFYKEIKDKINIKGQVRIDKYRVDFLIPDKKIVIELDGHEYHKTKWQRTNDARRERYLQKKGYYVIRFTGNEIYYNVEECVKDVFDIIKNSKL